MFINSSTQYCTGYAAVDAGTGCTTSPANASSSQAGANKLTKIVLIALAVVLGLVAVSIPAACIAKRILLRRYERSLEIDPELAQLPELGKFDAWSRLKRGRSGSQTPSNSGTEGSVLSEGDLRSPHNEGSNPLGVPPRTSMRSFAPRPLTLTASAALAPTAPSPAYTPRPTSIPHYTSPISPFSVTSASFSAPTSARPLIHQLKVDPPTMAR